MAGSYLPFIEVDDREILAALRQLTAITSNLAPAFAEIGEQLKSNATERFVRQVDPDGNPWARLSDVTIERKLQDSQIAHNANTKLVAHGYLMNQLAYQINGDNLEFGTNRVYGAMMQFGGTKAQFPHLWGDIPARPFLGISNQDKTDVLNILSRHIQRAF
jgi:phage virion morphogenesis protein